MRNEDLVILNKMLEEICYLQETTSEIKSFENFVSNEDKKRAVAMAFLNIGELANHLSVEFRESQKEIPFNEIRATRNNAAHGYFGLRFDFIWKTIHEDIPILKKQIKRVLGL